MGTRQERERPGAVPAHKEAALQIVVTWLSGLLLLAIAGFLAWEGIRPQSPAGFSHESGTVREIAGRFHLPLEVTNTGRESVKNLDVSLALKAGEAVVERAAVTLDWLPGGSSRRLVFVLEQDPGGYQTEVTFGGYQLP